MTISARPTDKLIERWLLSGPLRRPGASNDVLNQFEQENAVALPADMRDFFARLDGSGSYFAAEGDRLGFSFWSITRVRRAREELNARRIPQLPGLEDYFFFADYLSWSWAYAIRLVADASTGRLRSPCRPGTRSTQASAGGAFLRRVRRCLLGGFPSSVRRCQRGSSNGGQELEPSSVGHDH